MIGLSIVSNAGDQLVIQPHLYANHKGTEALFDIDELAAIVDGKVMHGRPTKLSGNTTQNTNFLRADAVTAFLEKTTKYNRWPHGAESIYDATLTASLEGVSLTGLCAYLQANSQRGNITPDSPITPKLRIILPENSGAQVPQGVAGAAQYPGTLRNSNGLMISSIEQGTSDLTTLDHSWPLPKVIDAQTTVLSELLESEDNARGVIADIYGGTPEEIDSVWTKALEYHPKEIGSFVIQHLLSLHPKPALNSPELKVVPSSFRLV